MKFYLVELTHKRTKVSFLKAGITGHYDVMKRFDDVQYADFKVRVIMSVFSENDDLIKNAERLFLQKYAKQRSESLERFLGFGDARGMYGFSGITETILPDTPKKRGEVIEAAYWVKQQIDRINNG